MCIAEGEALQHNEISDISLTVGIDITDDSCILIRGRFTYEFLTVAAPELPLRDISAGLFAYLKNISAGLSAGAFSEDRVGAVLVAVKDEGL